MSKFDEHMSIKNARENNLQSLNVDIPTHGLTMVTGVSGSGKSSLIMDTYSQNLLRVILLVVQKNMVSVMELKELRYLKKRSLLISHRLVKLLIPISLHTPEYSLSFIKSLCGECRCSKAMIWSRKV